jgi:hypothetical protein
VTRPAVTVLLAAAAIAAAALAAIGSDADRPVERSASSRPRVGVGVGEPTPTPVPPAVPRRALDRQDRTGSRHRRAESAAHDHRPLLTQLPLTRTGVTIDLAGLHADGRHALLTIRHPRSTRRHAQAIYRRALHTAHDTGHDYRTRYLP